MSAATKASIWTGGRWSAFGWAFMQGAAAFVIAILSSVLGAIADRGRGCKAWIFFWTLAMAAASAALWWGAPGAGSTALVLTASFAVGAIYAAAVFGMSIEEVLMFGILINVTAGIGAFAFAWLDDRLGPKPTALIGVAGVTACGIPMLLIGDKTWFYILGGIMGVFFGPAQAASRSLMGCLAPKGREAEMFGLQAFAG